MENIGRTVHFLIRIPVLCPNSSFPIFPKTSLAHNSFYPDCIFARYPGRPDFHKPLLIKNFIESKGVKTK